MLINGEDYFSAALVNSHFARDLYFAGRFVLAHYVSGLAVECIFRALRSNTTLLFDERHDLWELAKSSGFLDAVPVTDHAIVSEALGTVTVRWLNNHRYRSDVSLKRLLKSRKLDRKIKGDFLKENTRRIVDAALTIVATGERQWNSRIK